MNKVIFSTEKNEYYGIVEGQKIAITQAECYKFINSLGVKCYGSDLNGYVIYGK